MKKSLQLFATLVVGAAAITGPVFAASDSSKPLATETAQEAARSDVMEALTLNPDYSILVAALEAAELDDTLKGEGPFTVFAPTNAAFRKLPDGSVDALMEPANKAQLTKILLNHVFPGKVMAAQVGSTKMVTVEGNAVPIGLTGEKVTVGTATVTMADMEGTNGVVHEIDTVLMP